MTDSAPKILIIIVTWNKKDYVLQLLASLDGLDYPRAALDVVVVDNASSDGSADAIERAYPQVHVIRNPDNVGGTGGFNTGMAWAHQQPEGRYDYLWLLDNDVLVHRRALSELVEVLQTETDIGVAGSTMMQLDYPWRLNEMGAYFDRGSGRLVLNRHLQEVNAWSAREAVELAADPQLKLSQALLHCRPLMDVDYVAAASLLIRAKLARQAGLWLDFFIHFDDVEWCLRIGDMGQRVVVVADSIIWHLSAAAKVPTWVLYYDNRNVLVTLQAHGADAATLRRNINYIMLKAGYYALLGKFDLSRLHQDAVEDFLGGRLGKKDIKLDAAYRGNPHIGEVFADPAVRRMLVGRVNLQATGIQSALVQAMMRRPELQVEFVTEPDGSAVFQLPRARFCHLPVNRLRRWWRYWRLRGHYDLVLQPDYAPYPLLSWVGQRVVFINDEGFCVRPKPRLSQVWQAARWALRHRLRGLFS